MPTPIIRYELDITGTNPDNLVENEPHTLSDKAVRAIAPTYGPFFAKSVRLIDTSTGRLLDRGVHYQCIELLQDATLQYGKEICSIILVIDSQVSSTVSLTYQVLGGLFYNDGTAIANMFETVMKDDRPVLWENVLNKPIEYPPTLHRHLLEDLYGFEAIVAAIERLRNAIMLTDVPAFEALIEWVKAQLGPLTCEDASKNIPVKKVVTYDKLLVVLTRLWLLSDFKFGYVPNQIQEGTGMSIFVLAKPNTPNTRLYWEIIHQTSDDGDFIKTSGPVDIVDQTGFFNIEVIEERLGERTEYFTIGLKQHPMDTDYIAVTCTIKITNATPEHTEHPASVLFQTPECGLGPNDNISPALLFLFDAKNTEQLVTNRPRFYVPGDVSVQEVCINCVPGTSLDAHKVYLHADKIN